MPVTVRRESLSIPTYAPAAPDPHPMFLEKRVYQGSSGRVYPLPFIDRVAEEKVDRVWQAIFLENEFLEVMLLPEIGGRIHAVKDKTNGYDLFYRQNVIKPALVGLAGPWISGGVEFNWPQHHRPATFMPVEHAVEAGDDGSITVWMGDHDPMARMRGLHGVCLRPGSSVVELKVRVYNRTTGPQTFLWWANVAAKVNQNYQSFFPPDVTFVADHAKRSMSAFPRCRDHYYGVPYAQRSLHGIPAAEREAMRFKPPGTYDPADLSWYANIPVPTSYMCMGTTADFFGGYDHGEHAGFVHVANHHIAPGKKQWTWGNHAFGYAWDRLLSDGEHAPYIELMAGVYTDNQPDFSYLQPGETKTWSQYWYPIRAIGPAQEATLDAAVSLRIEKKKIHVGACVTTAHPEAHVVLLRQGEILQVWTTPLDPGAPFTATLALPSKTKATDLTLRVQTESGRLLVAYQPKAIQAGVVPPPATEPPAPEDIASGDELYLTGLHLEQYRHATRCPTRYWQEALRRDPGDARSHLALGRWHLRRGEYETARRHLEASIARQTLRNPNPADGEAHYQLGLTLLHLGEDTAAYAALYKATWNQAWQAAGFHALAELDCRRGDWRTAHEHLDRALRLNTDNLRARNLLAMVTALLGDADGATAMIDGTLALDPLDAWALWLKGQPLTADGHALLDLAHDLARAGFFAHAQRVLAHASSGLGIAPLVAYTRGWLALRQADDAAAIQHFKDAEKTDPTYCFPARLEDEWVLRSAIAVNPHDARAPYLLGNWLYDRRRHTEAIACFEQAVKRDPGNSIAWRNLGIGYANIHRRPAKAKAAYEKALATHPGCPRLVYERDQLWKQLRISPRIRLRELRRHPAAVALRDDLTVEFGNLLLQNGRAAEAQALLASRHFQPWEGGEGQALSLHVRIHLNLGRARLAAGQPAEARDLFASTLNSPASLGEARHLLANASDIHYWLGKANAACGDRASAKHHWTLAADFRGDFQNMSVCAYSEMTYYAAISLVALGRRTEAQKLLKGLQAYAKDLKRATAKIDYFATSLPTMLLFDADIQLAQETTAMFLEAQAAFGLGRKKQAQKLLATVLKRDPNHVMASDFVDATKDA